jgi:hypothetical protein
VRYSLLVDVGSGAAQRYTLERQDTLSVGEFVKLADGRVIRIVRSEDAQQQRKRRSRRRDSHDRRDR